MIRTLLACLLFVPAARAADVRLRDGDRVVLIGSTLVEREQRYGHWEAILTARHPDKTITFRNLGWSGDTVWGEARAGFGSVAEGYKHLLDHVYAEKPTVLIVGYGTNEAFAGEPGLPRFRDGLKKLLDDLAGTKTRLVLLAPPWMERMPRPLPDPEPANRNLALYAGAIRDEAARRGAAFVDLFERDPRSAERWTDNGLHLSATGYRHTGDRLAAALGAPAAGPGEILVDLVGRRAAVSGAGVVYDPARPTQFRARRLTLPEAADAGTRLRITGLPTGTFQLVADGQAIGTATAEQWAGGGAVVHVPADAAQVEKLRQTILAKNELYFHRWRPQNITYLFLFRKHEQGQNAREIPQFDPLVAAKEQEIAKLRAPAEHVFEITPAAK